MIEDLAGDARIGDERDDAQPVTAVGADENVDAVDAVDAVEEGGPLEAGWGIWVVGRIVLMARGR